MMDLGFLLCGALAIPFLFLGMFFAVWKEKAANFVSGFNTLPKEKQAWYDKASLSRDMRDQCFTWSAVMAAGAVSSYFVTPYMAVPAFVIWLILFFKEVRLDPEKGFEKYRLKGKYDCSKNLDCKEANGNQK